MAHRIRRRTHTTVLRGIARTWQHSWQQTESLGIGPWLIRSLLRPLRVLAHPRAHRQMLRLPIYRQFDYSLFRENGYVFHHLSGAHYLRKGLGVRQRVELALTHYTVESQQWRADYHQAVYGGSGLTLWRHEADGSVYEMRLDAEPRWAEGDLRLTFIVNNRPLHIVNFSWVVEPKRDGVVLFIGRSQGRSHVHPEGRAAFDRGFPHNSAMYFSYAAIVGIARAVNAAGVLGVRGHEQKSAHTDEAARFHRNYDGFWESLGGSDDGGLGIFIPLPDYDRPALGLSASHRKRALKRRRHWAAIAEATTDTLRPHFLGVQHAAGFDC